MHQKHIITITVMSCLLLALGIVPVSAEPVWLSVEDRAADRRFGEVHQLDQPDRKFSAATQAAAVGSALPEVVATFESAVNWAGGVNWGGETFGGSLGRGELFFGSSLSDADLVAVEVRFSTTDSTLAGTFRRDLGYAYNGAGVFPGTVWDVSNPGSPRRLNVCFVEDAGLGTPNGEWDPSSASLGKREYLFVMDSDYDGTGASYSGFNLINDANSMDIQYGWWPRVNTGSSLLQTLPATLFINAFSVTGFRGIPAEDYITLTWQWDDADPDQFDIYRGSSPGSLSLLATTAGSDRVHVDSGLTTGMTYYYRIEAVTGGSTEGEGPTIAATPEIVSDNVSLLTFWHGRGRYGDVWGYTDPMTDKEYALICARDEGVSIIDIDQVPAVEVGFIPSISPGTDAKDVKIYQDYAVIVKENEPIQIVDISDVTNPVQVSTFTPDGNGSHNCLIEGDYLYVVGNHGVGGLEIVDISNPASPVEVGQFQPFYYHDIDIRNDTICATGIYGDGIDLIDVSNKAVPSLISRFNYAGSGAHNAEYSFDGNYVFTGDEIGTAGQHYRVWDVSDPLNVGLEYEIIVDPNASAHNCYIKDDTLLFLAHYTEGVRVWNVVDPTQPYEVGYYDTFQPAEYGYQGCWSVYTEFASGRIIASDMQTGLYVFETDFGDPPVSCCTGNTGDINGDSVDADPIDLSTMVDFLFAGGSAPPCPEEADINGDTISADPIDLSMLVDFLFSGGSAPAACP